LRIGGPNRGEGGGGVISLTESRIAGGTKEKKLVTSKKSNQNCPELVSKRNHWYLESGKKQGGGGGKELWGKTGGKNPKLPGSPDKNRGIEGEGKGNVAKGDKKHRPATAGKKRINQ